MLKNMKVKTSLLVGFGSAILVSVCIIIVSLVSMNNVNKRYQEILDNNVQCNLLMTTARMEANIAARNVRDMALVPDSPNNPTLQADAEQNLSNINTYIEEMKAIYPLDDDGLNRYVEAVENWQSIVPGIIEDINAMNVDDAIQTIEEQCSPYLNTMNEVADEVGNNLTAAQDAAVTAEEASTTRFIIIMVAVALAAVVLVLLFAVAVTKNIAISAAEVHDALVGFSEGNLNVPVTYESNNELGEMCDALRKSQVILGGVIEDVSVLLGRMADGDFNVKSKDSSLYVGSLKTLIESLRGIKTKLSGTLTQISQAADQVSSGSDQVSSGAQALSQGATEQASSVEELSATIAEISVQVSENAENAQHASKKANEVGEELMHSNEQMRIMTNAMDEISQKSQEIGKIIKTIEDIAFQTNILALNAAVEAARAGAAGKGFAVVADEVRNLASKSAEASKNTSTLIEASVKAVENGTQIATDTAQALVGVVEGANEIVEMIDKIADASQQQADAVVQVTQGIDQISSVVQTNSATAEESAAASEELSSQANLLDELVGQFILSDEGADSAVSEPVSYSRPAESYQPAPSFDYSDSKY